MVSIDKAVLARYSHDGHHFEIYVDPINALKLRDGADIPLRDILASEEVYKDARKADKASEGTLQKVFGTTEASEVAKQIIKKGEIQLTTEQRKQMTEEKKKAIIAIIVREAYNPQTKTPHTPQRIETAIEETHVSINPFEKAEIQVQRVVDAIRPILPISIERLKLDGHIPAAYTGKAYGAIKHYTLEKEEWLPDGRLHVIVTIPAGIEDDFYNEINDICKGEAQFQRVK